MIIKWWCDSGANSHSCLTDKTTVKELGYTLEEWRAMTPDQKDKVMRDVALARLDWGYSEE
jgi:hypothetical protein